jgi:hypothetical protein
MSDPIAPIGPITGPGGARRVSGRTGGRDESPGHEAAASEDRALPVVVEPQPKAAGGGPRSRRASIAAFAAQLMGQPGQKRGLRGGPETLDRARSTYLETEWSGPADRRPRPGKITKTEI